MIWKTRQGPLDLTHRARVMGILNVTPDSFSDGGDHCGIESALVHARRMIAEGAEMIDIGGESTRPGALPVGADVVVKRVAGRAYVTITSPRQNQLAAAGSPFGAAGGTGGVSYLHKALEFKFFPELWTIRTSM